MPQEIRGTEEQHVLKKYQHPSNASQNLHWHPTYGTAKVGSLVSPGVATLWKRLGHHRRVQPFVGRWGPSSPRSSPQQRQLQLWIGRRRSCAKVRTAMICAGPKVLPLHWRSPIVPK